MKNKVFSGLRGIWQDFSLGSRKHGLRAPNSWSASKIDPGSRELFFYCEKILVGGGEIGHHKNWPSVEEVTKHQNKSIKNLNFLQDPGH